MQLEATRLLNLVNEEVHWKFTEEKSYGSYGQGNGPRMKLLCIYSMYRNIRNSLDRKIPLYGEKKMLI